MRKHIVIPLILLLIALALNARMAAHMWAHLDLEFANSFFVRRGLSDFSLLWRTAFITHVVSGSACWALSIFQFFALYKPSTLRFHKITGMCCVALIIICAISGAYSSLSGFGPPGFKIGLQLTFVVWILVTLIAVYQIKQGNIEAHVNWMIRSTLIGLSIITFRLIYVFLKMLLGFEYEDSFTLGGGAIFINLILAEIIVATRPYHLVRSHKAKR